MSRERETERETERQTQTHTHTHTHTETHTEREKTERVVHFVLSIFSEKVKSPPYGTTCYR